MPSIFSTKQLLAGYPKTHLPVEKPYSGCKVQFQLSIEGLFGLEEFHVFPELRPTTVPPLDSAPVSIEHEEVKSAAKVLGLDGLDDKMDVEDSDFQPITHLVCQEGEQIHEVDKVVVDKILNEQISQLNRLKQASVRSERVYESNFNVGEDFILTRDWELSSLDDHIRNTRSSTGNGKPVKNPPILEFLLSQMRVGEKLRVFCSTDYFSDFTFRYKLNGRSRYERAPSVNKAQIAETTHGGSESFRIVDDENTVDEVMGEDDFIQRGPHPDDDLDFEDDGDFVTSFVAFDLELNLFDLPEGGSVEEAKKYKELGNQAFNRGDLKGAMEEYFKGKRFVESAKEYEDVTIRVAGMQILSEILLNISAIQLKWNNADSVIQNTGEIIKMYPNKENAYLLVKAYFRRAQAMNMKEEYELGMKDCENALKLQPSNPPVSSLLKELTKKRQQQKGKEKNLFSGFFKKDETWNCEKISERLLKKFETQGKSTLTTLPLPVIFKVSEFLGFEFNRIATVNRSFQKIVDQDEWWMLVALRQKFYNPNKDPPMEKWKHYCQKVYATTGKVFSLPEDFRMAVFPDISDVYRGSSDCFSIVCQRIIKHVGGDYSSEERTVYEALRQLRRYWSLVEIFKFFDAQADFGKLNSLDVAVTLLKDDVAEYYKDASEDEKKRSKYVLSKLKELSTVDSIFNLLLLSGWEIQGLFPMIMRAVYSFYNIQPKSMKLGFYCSDGLLALILEENDILKSETIISWLK